MRWWRRIFNNMSMTTNMIKNVRSCLLMSASPSGSTCWFFVAVSALAGGASETLLTRGAMSCRSASGINLILVAGTFPLLLFQGVYPISLIALWSCVLNVGSPMGLVWAGGIPPLPLPPLPPLPHCWHLGSMVARNRHLLVGMLWYKGEGWPIGQSFEVDDM